MKKILNILLDENPLFVLCLGMCPALAVTTTLENGYMMGLSVLFILLLSNFVISILAKWIQDEIRIPAYIIIIATFVTITELLLQMYAPSISKSLGIYIPLIVVNCIVLGRALSYASHHKVKDSIKDALKIGLGYTVALSIVGVIRELIGTNTITFMDKLSDLTGYMLKYQIFPDNNIIPNTLFVTPAGAFLTLGILIGIINALKGGDVK